jgi:hypothetical protein
MRKRRELCALNISLYCLVILLIGCSDVVTTHYQTYEDAAKDGLFGRGWLPEFIPPSSFNITTSNNLDLNTSEGEFAFPLSATEPFASKLRPYSGRKVPYCDIETIAQKRKAQGYILYEFEKYEYLWVFFLNSKNGHAYYNLWRVR